MLIKFLLGKWYDNGDQLAPKLKRFDGSQDDIVLTLPDDTEVKDLKWISIWCRKFKQNFGYFIFQGESDDENDGPGQKIVKPPKKPQSSGTLSF